MQKPDIVLITLDYPPERGGVARYLENLVAYSGDRIRVIVPFGHSTEGPGRVEARRLFHSVWPLWWPITGAIRKLRDDGRETVVLLSHVFPVGTAAWISRMTGGPRYAIIFHGLDVRLAQSKWKRWLMRRICRNAKVVIANSQATKADVLKIVPGLRVSVITPGVEEVEIPTKAEARRVLNLDPNAQLVVSVARLVPRKGIDVALQAMARVQHRRDVQYVVVGDGPERARLEKVAGESRTRVTWIRDADDRSKWLWLAAADLFLLPIREEGGDVEGFGIAFLEAARAGVASVAGHSGGVPEAVRHDRTGVLVNPTNVKQIERAVSDLLRNDDVRGRLGQEGKRRALQEFRWEERAKTLLNQLDI